jgi:hypothetical protein
MNEIWKEIPSHPNYEASNTGYIRHKKKKNILKSKSIDTRHYQVISIITEGKKYTKKVARLVWEAFEGCPCGLTIDHIDRNPLNNNINNLRCVSHAINARNKIIYSNTNKYNLTDELKREIITKYINKIGTTWTLAHEYNIPFNYITTVVRRGSWNKFYQGNSCE